MEIFFGKIENNSKTSLFMDMKFDFCLNEICFKRFKRFINLT